MLKNKKTLLLFAIIVSYTSGYAQNLSLNQILDSIKNSHPIVKMYENEIRSMDEAAKGARSWMPPQIG